MSEDKNKISEAVQLYFDSMYESSEEKVRQVFHKDAKITGYLNGNLSEQSVDSFAEFVASQLPSPAEKNEDKLLEILSIEIAGSTAVAIVRDGYIGMVFKDTLSFLKIGEDWVIYNKLYHVES
ncbi:MAG: hypothetical protein CL768_00285 [Chloroflexi bacterium]|nr:hypothetical protein [Chloroflexota bacterium]|tara:strand:- start:18835 stop:19203 length:369 start_codon:yes stop_codon:yes gene_type:complete